MIAIVVLNDVNTLAVEVDNDIMDVFAFASPVVNETTDKLVLLKVVDNVLTEAMVLDNE
jgi:hypothetical protein